jgi:hypothetical protein
LVSLHEIILRAVKYQRPNRLSRLLSGHNSDKEQSCSLSAFTWNIIFIIGNYSGNPVCRLARQSFLNSPSATQIDSSPPKLSEASIETSDEPAPRTNDHGQRDKLEWYGTWETQTKKHESRKAAKLLLEPIHSLSVNQKIPTRR